MPQFKHRLSVSELLTLWLSRVVIWVAIILVIVPMLYVVTASFNPSQAYFSSSLIPSHPSLANYRALFAQGQFLIWLKNSSIVALSLGLGQLVITSTAAYAFSRMRFYGRKNGIMILLILQMFPNFLTISVIYYGLAQVGLLDNLWVYILVQLGGSAFNIWLLKNYFDTVPRELDEAAIMDGAGHRQIFWKIVLPLARPMLMVIFFFTLIGSFSEYILAGTIIQSASNYTLGLGLYSLISGEFAKNWGEFAAAALLSAAPLTIGFGIINKWIASGLVAGSVKG
ncbi:MAG: sugar ABC transporter permease [Sulfobacillus benefaciens]|uniref:Sugar ABC transporter permease n=1 Tax=Sulfobacillus benefaciens TaxID=453960 RepID=A0A2T2XK70_9FIRM|nr:MAG: sugar ABC transporter permease [Sulfobacillus benefaciens]